MIINYEALNRQINNSIQQSGLDIGAAYFIIKNICNDMEKLYYAQLNKEAMESQEEETVSLDAPQSSEDNSTTTTTERLES